MGAEPDDATSAQHGRGGREPERRLMRAALRLPALSTP
jgi:hypothetical protein